MRTRLLPLLLVASACGAGGPIPDLDVSLSVTAGATEVEIGRAFPVRVVRQWRKDLAPAAWDHEALVPLAARLESSERRETSTHAEVAETYLCWAVVPGEVEVRPAAFEVSSGGGVRSAPAAPFRVKVRRTLDPARPGAPELPGGLRAEPVRWLPWTAVALAAAGVATMVARRRRTRPAAPVPQAPADDVPPAPSPEEVALRALSALRARASASPAQLEADCAAVADVVRGWVAARHGIPTAERTTEEIASALDAAGDAVSACRGGVVGVLRSCDLVKFAARGASGADRDRLLDDASGVVGAGGGTP